MAKLLAGRFNRFVEKLFSTKEGAASLNSISPEIIVQASILNGVEDRYLLAWNRYAQDFSQAAVAAQFSIGEIRNPPGSGLILVIESLIFRNITAAPVTGLAVVRAQTTDQATLSTGQIIRLDPRGGPTPAAILSIGSNATQPAGANMFIQLPANTGQQFIFNPNQEWTVLPGDAFLMSMGSNNTQLTASVQWRERVLESSELS